MSSYLSVVLAKHVARRIKQKLKLLDYRVFTHNQSEMDEQRQKLEKLEKVSLSSYSTVIDSGACGHNDMNKDAYMDIGDFKVFAWSISGFETTVVVKRKEDKFTCCFDLGYACRQNINCEHVMISHGHMDHISAVPQHMKKRSLLSMKGASYHVPEHLVAPLTEVCKQFGIMSENTAGLDHPHIVPVNPGDSIKLTKGYFAVPFPTVHRVKSQGYLVYKVHRKLKPEFQGLTGPQIGANIQKGVQVHDILNVPEIAFTGDTTFEVFTQTVYTPPEDLFRVKLLIVEATYLDDECSLTDRVQQARHWGHIHLSEIYENAELFNNVENILLIHTSDKYSVPYVREKVFNDLPEILKGRVHVATIAKERYI